LSRLSQEGHFSAEQLQQAIDDLGIDPEKANPMTV
jgi:hypothetical protein